jgi:hypothetical protein
VVGIRVGFKGVGIKMVGIWEGPQLEVVDPSVGLPVVVLRVGLRVGLRVCLGLAGEGFAGVGF